MNNSKMDFISGYSKLIVENVMNMDERLRGKVRVKTKEDEDYALGSPLQGPSYTKGRQSLFTKT